MRFFSLICALFVAFVAAQNQYAINTPQGGFQVTAGQSITITWTPAPGSISIYLTQGAINTPGQGTLLAQSIDGSTGTATFTIPSTIQPSSTGQYNFGIAQASTGNFVNFSAGFAVSGASTSASASGSASSISASASSRASSLSASVSSQASSLSSAASSASSSASSRASSLSSSISSAASSAASSASRTATSSASAAATSVPSSNGAGMIHAGGLMAMVAGLVAVF